MRVVADLGLLPAHDPGERDGARLVGDHEVVRLQRALDAVERAEQLAGPRAAHDDPARELRVVERVQRVASASIT